MTLVVLLRGVNVGGHRSFRPKDLAARLRRLDVVNVGAAGTFVVRKPVPREELRAEFARRLPFESEIVICRGRDVARLLEHDAFRNQRERTDVVRFATVLSRSPRSTPSLPLRLPETGTWLVRVLARDGRFVLGVYRRHMRTIGQLGALTRIFGAPSTTRGWSTIRAIAEVVERGAT